MYWPGMEGDLQHHQATCNSCNANMSSQSPQPLILTPLPNYTFQADFFQQGDQTYLVYVDRLTGWLEVAHLPSGAPSGKIMKHLRHFSPGRGAPKQLSIDGGKNLVNGKMAAFFRIWGVMTSLSSAQYPQPNGQAQVVMKTAKRILRNTTGTSSSVFYKQ